MVNRHRRPSTQAVILIYRLNWCAGAKNYIELNWAFDFNSISEAGSIDGAVMRGEGGRATCLF